MTKVVTYLFDSMFQSKRKVSIAEKSIVMVVAASVLVIAVLFVF
jgi:hypothetical protein